MAKTYSVSLTRSTSAGYFTVAKNAESGTAADWHKEQGNGTLVGRVTEGTDYNTFTSGLTGMTAVSIQGDAETANNWSQAWHITTGTGDASITGLGDNSAINAGNGNNYVEAFGYNTTVVTGSGKDTISVGRGSSVYSGAGNDVVIADGANVFVNAGDGNDSILSTSKNVTIQAGSGNDVVELASGTNSRHKPYVAADNVVDLGAGDDSIRVDDGVTGAKITLGAGKDTVVLGADTSVSLTDYAFGTDVIEGITYSGRLTSLNPFESSNVFGTDGTLKVSTASDDSDDATTQSLTVNKTGGYYAVELTETSGTATKKQAFAWATADGGTINTSSYSNGAIITGANNGDAADYIIGGAGKDSIVAGANDSVYGGKGNDMIYVDDHANVTIGLYDDGSTDSVYSANFNLGDGYDDADNTSIYFSGSLGKAKFSLDSATATVTMTNGKGKLLVSNEGLPNVATTNTHTAVGFKVTNGASAYNTEVVAEDATVELFDGTTAVFGSNSGITLASDSDGAVIDLGNTGMYGDTRYYSGINKASAGTNSEVTLVGGAKTKDTLYGGTGATSLYGGGSANDSLVGGDGADTFFYGSSDGRDTISGYTYNADDADKSDTIALLSTDLTKVTRTSDALKLTFGSGTNNTLTVTTADSTDTAIALSINGTQRLAKVGYTDSTANSFSYDSGVTYYQGGRGTDTLTVTGEDDATIWLDGRTGTTYKSIDVVNAQGSTGNVTLAGGTGSEVLEAGTGDASLWGGASGNDTLVGGSGTNTFFFGKNNGSDTVQSTNEGDRVMLYDVALSDVNRSKTGANSNGAFIVTLNDGSKLTIENYSDNMQYTLADGATYTYQQAKGWTQA